MIFDPNNFFPGLIAGLWLGAALVMWLEHKLNGPKKPYDYGKWQFVYRCEHCAEVIPFYYWMGTHPSKPDLCEACGMRDSFTKRVARQYGYKSRWNELKPEGWSVKQESD
jgi:hypothetical protein